MHKETLQSYLFLALLAASSVLLFFVFSPFIQILALAAVFATLFTPLYERLAHAFGGWKSLSALLIVVVVLVFIIVPLFFLASEIFHEAQGLYAGAQGSAQYLSTIERAIELPIQHILPGFALNVSASLGNVLSFISGNLASFVSQTLYVSLDTLLMLLAFFFFLRDGRSLLSSVVAVSPIGKGETEEILESLHKTVQSVVRGTLVVALIRWICICIGFSVFHIPNAILWGSIGGIVGAIPGIGMPLSFIPALAYLYLFGDAGAAAGLAVFGIALAVLTDNILTPYFFGKGLRVPSVFVVFSILGGIIFFGPLGFILGPLALSLFLSVFRIYGTKSV